MLGHKIIPQNLPLT